MTARQKHSALVAAGAVLVALLGLVSLAQERRSSAEARSHMLSVLAGVEGCAQHQAYLARLMNDYHDIAFNSAHGDRKLYMGQLFLLMIKQARHDGQADLVRNLKSLGVTLGVDPYCLR